jgi:SulP family sulfate permease
MEHALFKRIDYLKNEALAGLTTSFAMVPETVAFAFVAGVNPLAGLYACFVGGLLAAVFGGRPAMISGGAGSLAVVCVGLVATYGISYLFAALVLMGVIQLTVGVLKWGNTNSCIILDFKISNLCAVYPHGT